MLRVCKILAVISLAATIGFAQDAPKQDSPSRARKALKKFKKLKRRMAAARRSFLFTSPMNWDVDQLVNWTAEAVARRYRLDPEQAEVAKQMLHDRTKAFLSEHEDGVRELLTDIWQVRQGDEMPSAEWAKQWAERSKPIFDAAKREILEGNEVFAEYLTEEQRKIHSKDMAQTRRTFGQLDERLVRWSRGGLDPEKDGWLTNAPRGRRNIAARHMQRPSGTSVGEGQVAAIGVPIQTGAASVTKLSKEPPIPVVPVPTHRFDEYVREFIKRYQLTEDQAMAAWGILSNIKAHASIYETRHADAFAHISGALEKIKGNSAEDQERKQRLTARYQKLVKPIETDFALLKKRLKAIPTLAQRKAAEAKTVAQQQGNPTQSSGLPTPPPGGKDSTKRLRGQGANAKMR